MTQQTTDKQAPASTSRRIAQRLPDRLSPLAENYLLSLYILREDGTFPTVTRLAEYLKYLPKQEHLGTTLPSVTAMVRRMTREGLLSVDKKKEVRLTSLGEKHAGEVARRHRLAERLIVDLLGMDLEQAEIQAHRLDHGISPEMVAALDRKLGYPQTCPYGRPVPGSGYDERDFKPVRLGNAPQGTQWRILRIPEEDPLFIKFLREHHLLPGDAVKVKERAQHVGVMVLDAAGQEVTVSFEAASRVWVYAQNT